MRVLVVTGFWPTSDNTITGIFVVQQVAAFARLGINVTVVVSKPLGKLTAPHLSLEQLGLPADRICLVEIPVMRLPEKVSSLPGAFRLNLRLFGTMLRDNLLRISNQQAPFDACIAHGIRYTGMTVPYWHSVVHGKIAVVVHGVDPFLTNRRNSAIGQKLVEAAVDKADSIVVVGNPLLPYATGLGMPEGKIQVVWNGTDIPELKSVTDSQRGGSEARHIISVSNLIPLKGIDDNIRALGVIKRRTPDLLWRYHVVGDGPERSRLEALAETLGIADRVRFLGRLPHHQTMNEVAAADIFSLPSWAEAFGIVYLEAMARMRPVIGCLDNGAADIISNGNDGYLVPPRDVSALACVLERLLKEPELCRSLGLAARAKAECFSWERNARQMASLLGLEIGVTE